MPDIELQDGTKMWYIEKGKGTPVVFVHGYWISSWEFEKEIDYFGQWYRAIAFDLPGHGKSDKPPKASYTLRSLTASLDTAVTKLVGDEKLVLVGQNMGGMISLIFATSPNYADRLKGLVLIGATGKFRSPATEYVIVSLKTGETKFKDPAFHEGACSAVDFHSKFSKTHMDFVKEFASHKIATDQEVALKTYYSMLYDYNVESKLGGIKVPTLILTGDKDNLILPQNSKLLHEKIKNSELVMLSPDIGHHIQFEAMDQFRKSLLSFLKKLS
jgi:pimeloyl-ACP methyl ester carboxylesterase